MNNPQQTLADAERAATQAQVTLEDPGVVAALARLERHYTAQWRNSGPDDAPGREDAYLMIRALDALRKDIAGAITGAAVTRRNLRSVKT